MIPITLRPLGAALMILSMTAPLAAAASSLPEVHTQGEVTFLSGGIGSDEAAAVKAESSRYALTLLFATRSGGKEVFLSSVPVTIRDASGNAVLDTVTEGPYLLVNLVPGRYQVGASHDGIDKTLQVDLKAGVSVQRSLVWPQGATETAPSVTAPDPAIDLPERRNQGGIPYLSGGIGSTESKAIRTQFANYALALTFATNDGGHNVFLASVPVQVQDATGTTVLDLTTDGPYLLIDLPPGRYEVITTHAGKEQRASVQVVAGRHVERAFVWTSKAAAQ